jgi:glucose-1-phosphate cytidylyltransferase
MLKALILAGGLGTRLREETEHRPKPLVPIGGRPILWHIMKILSHYGTQDFVIATGYRREMVQDFFLTLRHRLSDFTLDFNQSESITFHTPLQSEGTWRVTVADTGLHTPTGGRIKKAKRYLEDSERFLVAYGDGLANVNIEDLLQFHRSHGRLATVTTVRPTSRFGIVETNDLGQVTRFREKPVSDNYVSVGFFIFERSVLNYLDLDSVLEAEPLERLANEGQLMTYRHEGFWQPMDTFREFQLLNDLWDADRADWKIWND